MSKVALKQFESGGASNGQVVVWDAVAGEWSPADPGGSGSLFGQDYQRAEATAATTTTLTWATTKVSLTTPTLTGTYRVSFGVVLRHASLTSRAQAHFLLDPGSIMIEVEPKDTANCYNYHVVREVVFSAETRTFEVTHQTTNVNHACTAAEAFIEIFRLS